MRRRRPAPSSATVLPDGALHYLATGEILSQAEGVQRYGSAFDWLDAYDVDIRQLPSVWTTHRAEIEQHARRIGIDGRPWVQRCLDATAAGATGANNPELGEHECQR